MILFPSDKDFLKKNKNVLCGIFERVCVFNAYNLSIYRVKCDTSGRRDTKRYFVHFCLFFMTFRTFFFDWTTLKRFFVDHKDNIVNVVQTDTDADAMMEKETQNKETTKTTCYSSTKRWVE